ncbi:MAG: GNAT family N-acetyltransferase [Paracoccus sp. (in: a-proteobacteria)]|nr:GNAT family N-acetyltransferase [Paracoccus sp. (in: a-proteobacteria)]
MLTVGLDIPVIETARLILRAPRLADFQAMADFYATPRARHVGGPMTRDEAWAEFASGAGQWLLRGYGYWEIEDRETGATIGRAGLYHPDNWPEPELSWIIYTDAFEGRGIAHEAAIAARDAAAIMGITRPMSSIEADNARSIRLAERLGAVADGDWLTPYGPMLRYRHGGTRA